MFDNDEGFIYDPRRLKQGNSFLVPGGDWEVEEAPKPLTFHDIVRGISRVGLLFLIGLGATLFARLIPGVLPGYLLIVGLAIVGCIVYTCLSRRTSERILAVMVGVIVVFGIIGGSWDAIYGTMAEPANQKFGLQATIPAVALLVAVGASLLFRRSSK